MATVAKALISAAEFALLPDPPDGSKQELVRGEIVTLPPPGFRHGLRQGRVCRLLDHYTMTNRCGRVSVSCGVVTEHDPDTVRGPDVSYWSFERLPPDQEPEGYPTVAPDLCVEVLSPSNRGPRIREKLGELFAHGVRMVWVISPEDRTVTIYRTPDEGLLLHEPAQLTAPDVLPGFSCRVADLVA